MKKLTIGRNNVCDIIIPDTSDLVSRKQAVLTYSFFGKMVLYDTSNNGTYVNGQKLENGKGQKVTRKDKVNFARIHDLDWNEVKDPYRMIKLISLLGVLVVIIASALTVLWLSLPEDDSASEAEETEVVLDKGETMTTIQPVATEELVSPQPVRKKNTNKKGKKVSPKDVMNKEVNEKTPIVY